MWNLFHPETARMMPVAMRTAVIPQPGSIPQMPRMLGLPVDEVALPDDCA
jgi:hypothetical protein